MELPSDKERLVNIRDRYREASAKKRLWMRTRGEYIAAGGNHIIIPHETDPNLIYGVSYDLNLPSDRAKDIFDVQKMFSTLFPHNFPRFHMTTGYVKGDPEGLKKVLTGEVRERIYMNRLRKAEVRYGIKPVESFLDSQHVSPVPLFDWYEKNFGVGKDGGQYYLDTALSTQNVEQFDPEKVTEWMKTHKVVDKKTYTERPYTQQELIVVTNAISRVTQRHKRPE